MVGGIEKVNILGQVEKGKAMYMKESRRKINFMEKEHTFKQMVKFTKVYLKMEIQLLEK